MKVLLFCKPLKSHENGFSQGERIIAVLTPRLWKMGHASFSGFGQKSARGRKELAIFFSPFSKKSENRSHDVSIGGWLCENKMFQFPRPWNYEFKHLELRRKEVVLTQAKFSLKLPRGFNWTENGKATVCRNSAFWKVSLPRSIYFRFPGYLETSTLAKSS